MVKQPILRRKPKKSPGPLDFSALPAVDIARPGATSMPMRHGDFSGPAEAVGQHQYRIAAIEAYGCGYEDSGAECPTSARCARSSASRSLDDRIKRTIDWFSRGNGPRLAGGDGLRRTRDRILPQRASGVKLP
jgi:hypothetical protein